MDKKLKEIIRKADKCNSFFSRTRGFMFSLNRKQKPKLLIFKKEKTVQIHTFFCFFPLEIIYFDKNFNTIRQETAKPFQILLCCRAKYILEMPISSNYRPL